MAVAIGKSSQNRRWSAHFATDALHLILSSYTGVNHGGRGMEGCIPSNILIWGMLCVIFPQIFCRLWCQNISNKQWTDWDLNTALAWSLCNFVCAWPSQHGTSSVVCLNVAVLDSLVSFTVVLAVKYRCAISVSAAILDFLSNVTAMLWLLSISAKCCTFTQTSFDADIIMVALWNRADHYILLCGFFFCLSLSFFSSPNLSRRRLDVCYTSTHGVALPNIFGLSANLRCRSETCYTRLAEIQDAKKSPKSPSGHHCTTSSGYIFTTRARIDNWKKNF